jgi:hypothetical protein
MSMTVAEYDLRPPTRIVRAFEFEGGMEKSR